MEKQHIIDLLLKNTDIESRYVGGGEEPTIIVFKDSEWWGLEDRQRFFETLIDSEFKHPMPDVNEFFEKLLNLPDDTSMAYVKGLVYGELNKRDKAIK